jgi:hypothetical protein
MALIGDLNDRGIRSKARTGRDGRAYGNAAIGRGALYAMLRNRLYVGEVVHNGHRYPGRHQAILDVELFERAQAALEQNQVDHRRGTRHRVPSLLSGLLWDGLGRRMSPSQSSKALVHYRYYTSQHATAEDVATQKWRISAPDIEGRVVELSKAQLDEAIRARIESQALSPDDIERLRDTNADIAKQLDHAVPHDRRELVRRLVSHIVVERDRLLVTLALRNADPALLAEPAIITLPISCVRVGSALKLMLPPAGAAVNEVRTKPALVKLVAQAMGVRETMEQGRFASMDALAEASGYGREHATDLLRIAYLAPDITAAILDGRQPDDLTRSKLIRWPAVPLQWGEQRRALGFA